MSGFVGPLTLAPVGSTGNNSHAAAGVSPAAVRLAVEFVVEAAGGTPTVTYALQGSFKEQPGSNDWFPLAMVPSDSDTAAATRVVTAVGTYGSYLSQGDTRFIKRVRVVTTANTNITYSANLFQHYGL